MEPQKKSNYKWLIIVAVIIFWIAMLGRNSKNSTSNSEKNSNSENSKYNTEQVSCQWCGTVVSKEVAWQFPRRYTDYYFCSKRCSKAFAQKFMN